MKMKKMMFIAFAFVILILSACKSEPEKPAYTADFITSAITKEITIPSSVKKDISNMSFYYEIDEEKISDMSMYLCASGAYPDEITVFVLSDTKYKDDVVEAVKKHLESQIKLFRDYTPDEMYKLDNAILKADGNYVYLLACENNSRADEIVSGLLK